MYVLINPRWLLDTVGENGFDINLMKVRIVDRQTKTLYMENGNRPELLAVPFDQVWNLTLGDES